MFILDTVQNFIKEFIGKYQLLLSIVVLLVQIGAWFIGAYVFKNWLQTAKNELDKNADAYRHRLQIEYLKTEIKTTQLSSLYPKLFMKFKIAESLIGDWYRIKQSGNAMSPDKVAKVAASLSEATGFMVRHMLFMSDQVIICSDKLSDSMNLCKDLLAGMSPVETITSHKKNMNGFADNLQAQMKDELGTE